MLIAVAGCVAQAEGAEIMARQPAVDLVVGPQSYHRLPEMIARAARAEGKPIETDFPALEKFDALAPPQSQRRVSAFLTVQEGCDKFCTFCVVPYTRGAEHSRPRRSHPARSPPAGRTKARAKSCCWARTSTPMPMTASRWPRCAKRWRRSMASTRIRYTTSHPRDMGDDLIAAHGDNREADALSAPAGAVGHATRYWRR